MKILSLGFALLAALPLSLSAETYVRFADHSSSDSAAQNDFVPTAAEGTSFFTLRYERPGGDGTSEEAPGKVYVPIDPDTTTQTTQNNTHFYTNASNGLPGLNKANSNKGYLRVRLDVRNDLGEQAKLWVAAKDDSDTYRVFGRTGDGALNHLGTFSDGTETTAFFTIELADLCYTPLTFMSTACGVFNGATSTSKDLTLYLFLDAATRDYADDKDIDPASLTNGVYMRVYLSSKTLEGTLVTLVELTKGDGRISISYAGANPSDLDTVYAYSAKTIGANPGGELLVDLDSGVSRHDLQTTETNHTAVLKGLENGVSYQLSVSFLNKFGFSTKTSNSKVETPLDIEEFLKSQACYLLSAGFGEEHYVIEYFKGFRDHFLKKYYLGRAFINFYYETAPKYALYIYGQPWLTALVRGAAYVLYFVFIFNGLPLAIVVLIAVSVKFVYSRALKECSD